MIDFTFAVQHIAVATRSWFGEPTLAIFGATFLGLVPVGAIWAWRDPRQVDGVSVAVKPLRFALSIGIYILTASAMFDAIRPDRRSASLPEAATWMMILGSTIEFGCIFFQAARARRSHFNKATPSDTLIYAIMGTFALLFIGAVVPLALAIVLSPDPQISRLMVTATVAGLLLTFFFGGGTGAAMSSGGLKSPSLKRPPLPLLGWNLSDADMRAPHFFGIHAMQMVPIIAVGARVVGPAYEWPLFASGTAAYVLVTAGLLRQALSARLAPVKLA